jgi:hypothetical protein
MNVPVDRSTALPPRVSTEEIRRLVAAQLSLRARLGYVGLLLGALGVTSAVASLWLTEPSLPVRTHIAFGLIVVVGLSWVGYAGWVLTRRRVLLAGHRVVAARMAIAFSALFTAFSLALGFWGGLGSAPHAAAALGGAMLVAALAIHAHARRRFARLLEQRRVLLRQTGAVGD